MDPQVDEFFADVRGWRDEAQQLRAIMLDCGLDEALKWNKPCYGYEGRNIAIIQHMNDFVALMFFRGALLNDPEGLLEPPGANSRSARRACFTSVEQVRAMDAKLRDFVHEAIAANKAGLELPEFELVLVDELQEALDADPELAAAFEGLTPGRQREYNLHISGAKQSKTRIARVEKFIPAILDGKGMRD